MRKIAFVILIMFSLNSYAVELVNEKAIIKFIKDDFDVDGIKEEVRLISKQKDIKQKNYFYNLEIKSKEKTFLIEDVISSNANSCGLESIRVSDFLKPFIGISQNTGKHSWVLILYSFDGEKIEKVHTFVSNFPSILLEDVDNDGENEIIVSYRDVDSNNPNIDRIIDTYDYDRGEWKLVSIYSTRLKKNIPLEEWRYLKPSRINKSKK